MLVALEAVQMDKLPMDVHMVWMKVMKSQILKKLQIQMLKSKEHFLKQFLQICTI
jgi:hypothetical protein